MNVILCDFKIFSARSFSLLGALVGVFEILGTPYSGGCGLGGCVGPLKYFSRLDSLPYDSRCILVYCVTYYLKFDFTKNFLNEIQVDYVRGL